MSQPLITWKGLWEAARQKAFIRMAVDGDNSQNALIVLSRAQHDLQDYTNATRRVVTVPITGASNGLYALPLDIKQPLEAQFTPTGTTTPCDCKDVPPEEMDLLQRRWAQNSSQFIGWMYPLLSGIKFVFTIDQQQLIFFPWQTITGTFWLRYLPHLHEYQSSNPIGDWSTAIATSGSHGVANGTVTFVDSAFDNFTLSMVGTVITINAVAYTITGYTNPSTITVNTTIPTGTNLSWNIGNLSTWMATNGPEREYTSAAGGMSSLLAIDLLEKAGMHKAYPERVVRLMAEWEACKAMAERNKPLMSKNLRMPHMNGPLP